jgi:hypothetical protein
VKDIKAQTLDLAVVKDIKVPILDQERLKDPILVDLQTIVEDLMVLQPQVRIQKAVLPLSVQVVSLENLRPIKKAIADVKANFNI